MAHALIFGNPFLDLFVEIKKRVCPINWILFLLFLLYNKESEHGIEKMNRVDFYFWNIN